jgi:hypothetical protein
MFSMLTNNQISIFRKFSVNQNIEFCLQFSGDGYISIDALTPFLDHKIDFSFVMAFKIDTIPEEGYAYLMNSCFDRDDNKLGIAIDRQGLYVQVYKGQDEITELFIPFEDTRDWHSISVVNVLSKLSASLDENVLEPNTSPVLSLPVSLGFRIASDTSNSQNLFGFVDNILLTSLGSPVAQFLLNEGSGNIANDSVGSNNGSIINGQWLQL